IERVGSRSETRARVGRVCLGAALPPGRLEAGVGAMVPSVDKQGPAAQAGIRQGDVIVAVTNERIAGVRALIRSLGPDSVGSTIELAVQRAGEPLNLKLTVGERPEA